MNKILKYFNQLIVDNRGQTIYYHAKDKLAYKVPDASKTMVNLLHQRFTISILVGLLLYFYRESLLLAIVGTLFLWAIMEFILKQRVLPQLHPIHKYNIEEMTKKELTPKMIKRGVYWTLLKLVLSVVFIVVALWDGSNQDQMRTILLVLVGLYFLLTSLKNLLDLYSKRKLL